jgi:hypothetical protein
MTDLRTPLFTALLCASMAMPAMGQRVPGFVIAPLGYCSLSVTGTAVQTSTCAGTFAALASYAAVCNEGNAARWRDDGAAPTASVGQPLGSGSATAPTCQAMATTFSTLQWIAQSGTATLNFTFYK